METWRSAVFQVLQGGDRKVLGTAFSIFGGRVLTCMHVLLGQDKVLIEHRAGQAVFNFRSVFLFRSVDQGPVAVAEWAFHDEYDVACGRLAEGASFLSQIPLQTAVVTPSTSVTCAGFPASGADTLYTFERSVAAQGPQGLILDGALAPGMSGGPALVNGRAIGVVYADTVSESMGFLVPLNAISNWIERVLPPIPDLPANEAGLAGVPIAGSLRFFDIPPTVIEVFSRQFDDRIVARNFFRHAMALRAQWNPEGFTENQILVRPSQINWESPPEAFWSRIFELCAQRSQRTLAALFFATNAPQSEFLAHPERMIFEQFRIKLMH
ncbi:serine protease [Mesorhizobium sp. M0924]|uniref:S1 family peptidase n=1 Tax=unclassified Mesorhizobium TaxID=325217 RepID=UPI00333ACCBE